jgi:N-acetyl-alpha-D-muramate 1-phosphate uridylyltransferase
LLDVALLAGGMATRLRPVTESIPKSLVDVSGEPFIAHQLKLLASNGIRRVVVCAGFLGEMICDAIGNGRDFGVEVEYSFDGDKLLGTAGAVRNALHLLGDSFFVLYGDSYLVCDYSGVEGKFWASRKSALMTVYRNEGKWDTSNVEFENGRILAYSKKNRTPRMSYIDYGLGVFSAGAFDHIAPGEPYDLAELYAKMLEWGQLAGMEVHQRFYEIGSSSGLEETTRFLAKEKVGYE